MEKYTKSSESKNPNENYSEWQKAMEDTEFQGNSPTKTPEKAETEPKSRIEKLFSKIHDIKRIISEKLGISDKKELTEATNEALVHIAQETIDEADTDNNRTAEESKDIKEAVDMTVVEGASQEASTDENNRNKETTSENPIVTLHESNAEEVEESIDGLQAEDATIPGTDQSVAGLARRAIEQGKQWSLEKVSGQLGSNEGGWYEAPTGERFYVKFYENPNQGRAEFIANAIYEKLGIKAVRSKIITLDGREAIASPAVPEASSASKSAQIASEDVQKGFVADAFLANWDVVGLVFDNIVQSRDGLFRIDNGGSLIFRAQGGDKEFSPDSIPELQSMRVQRRPSGEVFGNITEEEIKRQAQDLISKITPEDIRAIVDESGVTGEDRDRILTGLLGRLEYLTKTYGGQETVTQEPNTPESKETISQSRIGQIIEGVKSREMERSGEYLLRPRTEIICDHDHIEDQRIDVINKKDRGLLEFSLKLRQPTEAISTIFAKYETAQAEGLEEQAIITTPSGAIVKRDKIRYEKLTGSSKNGKEEHLLCDAFTFEKEGVKVSIADSTSREGHISDGRPFIRTAIGLIKIEAPIDMSPEDTERILSEILEKDLGIPSALSEVPKESKEEYKRARFAWQHKISGELTPEQKERAEKLEEKEVFPGYTAEVEVGKHKEYLEKYGDDICVVHSLGEGDAKSIFRILTRGAMSSTERFSRGLLREGSSTASDMERGGADSVFTRVLTREQLKTKTATVVIFKPEVLDRTDWYSYSEDKFGGTSEETFAQRLSPDELLSKRDASRGYPDQNEQMFRVGIGPEYIESIEVAERDYEKTIKELKAMGLEEINGRPIEEIVVPRKELPREEKTPSPEEGPYLTAEDIVLGDEEQALLSKNEPDPLRPQAGGSLTRPPSDGLKKAS